jgi:type IV pilus assembly protein PilY1
MSVTADFNGNGTTTDAGDTRTFYAAYMVFDITNPEKDPTLLWVFTDASLGLSTSYPAILRVSPSTDAQTDNTNAKWMVVFGSGPTGYNGNSTQVAKFFVVDLVAGPSYGDVGGFTGPSFSTGDANSFMGDVLTVDVQLDYRVDVIYAGNTISNGEGTPNFYGKLYRLTTGASTNTGTWGVPVAGADGARKPTVLLSSFTYTSAQATTCATASPCKVGPVTASPNVGADEYLNLWVFFGTGRFFTASDKSNTEIQHLYGIKDCILNGTCADQTVQRNNLLNVSSATVCLVCSASQVTGVPGVSSFDTGAGNLVGTIQGMDGWFTTLPNAGERALTIPTVIGGTVFVTSLVPDSDICNAAGNGNLYALYNLTGTAYKDSTIGTTLVGSDVVVNRSISLGIGVPSQIAIQIGAQGSGTAGSSSNSGSAGRLTAFVQSSSGVLVQVSLHSALPAWSRMVAWRDL